MGHRGILDSEIDADIKAERNKEYEESLQSEGWEDFLADNGDLYKEFIKSMGLRDDFIQFVKTTYQETK